MLVEADEVNNRTQFCLYFFFLLYSFVNLTFFVNIFLWLLFFYLYFSSLFMSVRLKAILND